MHSVLFILSVFPLLMTKETLLRTNAEIDHVIRQKRKSIIEQRESVAHKENTFIT
jgi:hypothetical protein